jgi:hypothetical protein
LLEAGITRDDKEERKGQGTMSFYGSEDEDRLTKPVTQHDHIRGRMDAPMTLVEYGDFVNDIRYNGPRDVHSMATALNSTAHAQH